MNLLAYNCIFNRPSMATNHQSVPFTKTLLQASSTELKPNKFTVYNGNNILGRIYMYAKRYFGNDEFMLINGDQGNYYVEKNEYLRALVSSHYTFTPDRVDDADRLVGDEYLRANDRWQQCIKFLEVNSASIYGTYSLLGQRAIHENILSKLPLWFGSRDIVELNFEAEASAQDWEQVSLTEPEGYYPAILDHVDTRIDGITTAPLNFRHSQAQRNWESVKGYLSRDSQAAMEMFTSMKATDVHHYWSMPQSRSLVDSAYEGLDVLVADLQAFVAKGHPHHKFDEAAVEHPPHDFDEDAALDDYYIEFKKGWGRLVHYSYKGALSPEDRDACMAPFAKAFLKALPPQDQRENIQEFIASFFSDDSLELIEDEELRAVIKREMGSITKFLNRRIDDISALKDTFDKAVADSDAMNAKHQEAVIAAKQAVETENAKHEVALTAAEKAIDDIKEYKSFIEKQGKIFLKEHLNCKWWMYEDARSIVSYNFLKQEATMGLFESPILGIDLPEMQHLDLLKQKDLEYRQAINSFLKDEYRLDLALERLDLSGITINGGIPLLLNGRSHFSEPWMNQMWSQLPRDEDATEGHIRIKRSLKLCGVIASIEKGINDIGLIGIEDRMPNLVFKELLPLLMIDVNPGAIDAASRFTTNIFRTAYSCGGNDSRVQHNIRLEPGEASHELSVAMESKFTGQVIFSEEDICKVSVDCIMRRRVKDLLSTQVSDYDYNILYQGA